MTSSDSQDHRGAALLLIDIQNDFCSGGALACHEPERIFEPIEQLLRRDNYGAYVATQDWHPRNHNSFASQHEGRRPFEPVNLNGIETVLWPDHCVAGTEGAALHEAISWVRMDMILRKGRMQYVDTYSAFMEGPGPDGEYIGSGLAGWLRERNINEVHVAGLAREYCVLSTARDARKAGFETKIIWDLTGPVDPQNDDSVRKACEEAGIGIIH